MFMIIIPPESRNLDLIGATIFEKTGKQHQLVEKKSSSISTKLMCAFFSCSLHNQTTPSCHSAKGLLSPTSQIEMG